MTLFRFLREKQLFGDAFWVILGQIVSAIALLAGTRMLTELVSPEIYGQVALLNGFVALGVALFSYPFICAGMRIVPECQNEWERAELYQVVAGYAARSTALAVALLLVGGLIYRHFYHSDFILYLLAGLLLIVTVRRELGIQLLIGGRKQRSASLWQTTDSLLRPLLAISLVVWGGQKPEWVLLGYILASLISNRVWSFVHRSKTGKQLRPSMIRNFKADVWTYALPLIPMELLFWVNGMGDRYVIGYLLSAAEVGLYAATYMIINEAFNRSAMVLLRIFQPVYFQCCSRNQAREGFRILWIWIGCVVALGIIGVTLLLLSKGWVTTWLLAKSYHSSVELIPAIAVGCALNALGMVLSQPLLANKQTRLLLSGRLCGALTAAVSIPLMVIHYGLPGAAFANCIYFGVEAIVLAMLAKPWRMTGHFENGEDKDPVEEAVTGCKVSA
ncbi:MAG: lipopolysaccharide biosynthesis protein [Methylicorpusculum sp.]|uniref:lipopolysaccharide biosynthesis protein n=1 Tax=Methylicorpusculum sp. TaxID=2713644 RepID=UPI002717BE45|nr:lipopolysaccharide biosynthesis protein [Methylicorpusculum sp.]MDO8939755.1 lipopolysaccharide biosynthesis protein [Methylicorpusculum sp.]MDP2201891.1 lipopolysaccharide biosynthesis protein [Methylicorpusculum sp.]